MNSLRSRRAITDVSERPALEPSFDIFKIDTVVVYLSFGLFFIAGIVCITILWWKKKNQPEVKEPYWLSSQFLPTDLESSMLSVEMLQDVEIRRVVK